MRTSCAAEARRIHLHPIRLHPTGGDASPRRTYQRSLGPGFVRTRTRVGIVGAGPAGLLLAHLLHQDGVDSVVMDIRSRAAIEATIRAGVLEQSSVDLLVRAGVGDRMLKEGTFDRGLNLLFGGALHRIDLHGLTGGRALMLYAQHEVLKDLIAQRLADDEDIRFSVSETAVHGLDTDRPALTFSDADGVHRVECDFIVGCDGAHGLTRSLIPATARTTYFRQYPFAWFGILAQVPRPVSEVTYAHSERGFALVSSRSATVQRMYFQCPPATDPNAWSDDQIWAELGARVAADGVQLEDGPILQKDVLEFRSLVCEPMQHGRLFLAGDAAHTVPPTGAKGMNLAFADVDRLSAAFAAYFGRGDRGPLDAYSSGALRRVWRMQHFSWWMTSMLHRFPEGNEYDVKRQLAELETVVSTPSASQMLAEFYVGPAST